MGMSYTLVQRDGSVRFELAIDVDTEPRITLGTGFSTHGVPSVNVEIPVTLEGLKQMSIQLQDVISKYEKASRCPDCDEVMMEGKCTTCMH